MLTVLQRPRPYEVELIGRWAGYSMPSLPITVLTAFLVSTLYSLVPAGRHRTLGKWVICGLLAVTALSRLYLAQDHPTDIARRRHPGVAVPLAAFRWLAPNDVFPVTYHRGRTAHLDVTGSAARRSSGRCRTSSGCSPPRSSRSTWTARAAPRRCGSP